MRGLGQVAILPATSLAFWEGYLPSLLGIQTAYSRKLEDYSVICLSESYDTVREFLKNVSPLVSTGSFRSWVF